MAEAPGVELAAVVDPDPKARCYAEATPGYKVLEEALEAVECDAVLVASPPGYAPRGGEGRTRGRQARPM
jgi:predicted dehydrogenase